MGLTALRFVITSSLFSTTWAGVVSMWISSISYMPAVGGNIRDRAHHSPCQLSAHRARCTSLVANAADDRDAMLDALMSAGFFEETDGSGRPLRPEPSTELPSHTTMDIDEDGDAVLARFTYVDEETCIGCRNCAYVARNVFFMVDESCSPALGKARVFSQVEALIEATSPWAVCDPHAQQPWAVCDPHAQQPWAVCDHCLAGRRRP